MITAYSMKVRCVKFEDFESYYYGYSTMKEYHLMPIAAGSMEQNPAFAQRCNAQTMSMPL